MRRSLLTLGIGRIITSMYTLLRLLRQRVDQKNCEQHIDVWLESLAVASAGDRRSVFHFPMHAFSEGVRLSLTPDLLYSSHNSRPIPVLLCCKPCNPASAIFYIANLADCLYGLFPQFLTTNT